MTKFEDPKRPWEGSFEAESEEEAAIKQIVHNCSYWDSPRCKRATVEDYLKHKGITNPEALINRLISQGTVHVPKKGYIGLTDPEKHGLVVTKK